MDAEPTGPGTGELRAALAVLARRLDDVTFALDTPQRDDRHDLVRELRWIVREYLLPRLDDLDAPAVVVLVGSTGAGKSTLLNALAEAPVSRPGAVRPTTRVPVVWAHRDHADRYAADLLPGFAAADRDLRVVAHADDGFHGVTIVDTPDLDSVVADHRRLAEDLLAVADLCVWVTTAQRYADAIPWDVLRGARDRGLPIMVVCNRVPDRGADRIVADLRARLVAEDVVERDAGLDIVTIAEQTLTDDDALPPHAVDSLRGVLGALGGTDARSAVVAEALRGAVDHVARLGGILVEELAAERDVAAALGQAVDQAYRAQLEELVTALADGRLVHGEVLQRWQDFVGTGELVRAVAAGAGRLRSWARRVLGGREERARQVTGEARSELVTAIVRRADRAATSAAGAWELSRAGGALLAGDGSLWRADPATDGRAARVVDDWVADLAALVEEEGEGRRRVAQVASAGVNAVALTLMLAVFAQTGGLTGAEVGITAGAAALQQRLLEHLFGAAAARRLVLTARERLVDRATEVLAVDRARFDRVLAAAAPAPEVGPAIAAEVGRVGVLGRRFVDGLADG